MAFPDVIQAAPAVERPRLWAVWLAVLAVGAAGWGLAWTWTDAARMWRAVLISFMLFTPMAAALTTWPAVVQLSRGRWAGRLEATPMRALAFAPVSLALLAVLWIACRAWAPWADTAEQQGAWLSPPWLFGRDMIALATFWVLAWVYLVRRNKGSGTHAGAALVIVYCVVFSLLGFDLLMALDPRWSATMFGGYVFITGMYAGAAMWTLLAACRKDIDRDRLHDLAKLLVAFGILSGYLAYAHLLPIWYENMPAETRFFVPRLNYIPWQYVSWAMLFVYLGPLVFLLTIRAKRSRPYVIGFTLVLLAMLWVDRWWLVAPTFSRHLQLGLPELGALGAFVGLLGLSMDLFGTRIRVQERETAEDE